MSSTALIEKEWSNETLQHEEHTAKWLELLGIKCTSGLSFDEAVKMINSKSHASLVMAVDNPEGIAGGHYVTVIPGENEGEYQILDPYEKNSVSGKYSKDNPFYGSPSTIYLFELEDEELWKDFKNSANFEHLCEVSGYTAEELITIIEGRRKPPKIHAELDRFKPSQKELIY